MDNDKVPYRDRKIWSDLWIKIYDRIEYLRTNADYRSYKRAVFGLVNRLYKEERLIVLRYMEDKGKPASEYTIGDIDELSIVIQDLLEDNGYIKYTGDKIETGKEEQYD